MALRVLGFWDMGVWRGVGCLDFGCKVLQRLRVKPASLGKGHVSQHSRFVALGA